MIVLYQHFIFIYFFQIYENVLYYKFINNDHFLSVVIFLALLLELTWIKHEIPVFFC